MNKNLKKDLLDNHFEYGGKLLISPDPEGPIHLLDSEKRLTYFSKKDSTDE